MVRVASRTEDTDASADVVVSKPRTRSGFARVVKLLAQKLALALVSWRLLLYWISWLLVGKETAFAAASESISRIPGLRGVYLRQAFYRSTLATCGKDVYFGWQTVFSKTGARLGDSVYLGRRCSLGLVDLGTDTMLSDGVQVLSGRRQHGTEGEGDTPYVEQPRTFSRICVGPNAWIGTHAIIMADVGYSTIVGAGAVVIEPIPESCLAVGVPAKVKRRFIKAGTSHLDGEE